MKCLLTILLGMLCISEAFSQWSNTSNDFFDSLFMPVSYQPGEQVSPITINSYPDNGTITIWLDKRTDGNETDIYAQKIDPDGYVQWTADGVPVATGPTDQRFGWPDNNADYRYYNYACTDSAGGFYVVWEDGIQIGPYIFQRVCVQHILADGSRVFGETGFIAGDPSETTNTHYRHPQLVGDGLGGFFVGYLRFGAAKVDLFVYNYRDEGGVMVRHGGGKMDPDVFQGIDGPGPCAVEGRYFETDYEDRVTQFYIYPDMQQGCGIVWSFDRNTAQPNRGPFIVYNKLCRVKKSCTTVVRKRTTDVANTILITTTYEKDSVIQLYNFRTFTYTTYCLPNSQLSEVIENGGEGYLILDMYHETNNPIYDLSNLKAGIVPTGGNVNAGVVAVVERKYIDNLVTPFFVNAFYRYREEVYDSIPYQLSSDDDNPYWAYRLGRPADQLKLNYGFDTLLSASSYFFDFNLAISGNRVLATAKYPDPTYTNAYSIGFQEWKLEQVTADSFAMQRNTPSAAGLILGKEINTGFQGTNITYTDNPLISTDGKGNALFQISELGRSIRVSPIDIGGKLTWGAMGRSIGNATGGNYPTSALKEQGTGVIVWNDPRYIAPNYYYNNIYMRHLGGLTQFNTPPLKKVLKLGSNLVHTLYPYFLTGLSNAWSVFEAYQHPEWTAAIEILDDHNLGNVLTSLYQHDGVVRQTEGAPYLDRNYTIIPDNLSPGGAPVQVRFYFTNEEFEALSVADPSVQTPADLVIVKQPHEPNVVPTAYTKNASDEVLTPSDWGTISGGYFLQVGVESFSNFFIMGSESVLPLTWVSVKAEWQSAGQAIVSWITANQQNVRDFLVEHSNDGVRYESVCTVAATSSDRYSCTVPANENIGKHFFRVLERDFDGQSAYSQVVTLYSMTASDFVLSPNPASGFVELRQTGQAQRIRNVILYNVSGVRLYTQQVSGDNGAVKIPVYQLPGGVYHVRITTDKGVSTMRFVKK